MTQTMGDTFQVELANSNNLFHWLVSFTMQDGVYAGERYTLSFTFGHNYPIEAPTVMFSGAYPHHEHIYSNGWICMALLYDDWSPSLRVSSIGLSIITLLATARRKGRPDNDARFVQYAIGKTPKQIKWEYD